MTLNTLNSDIARMLDHKATKVEIQVALQTSLGYLPKVIIEYTLSEGQRRIGRTRQGSNVLAVRIQLPKPAKAAKPVSAKAATQDATQSSLW